MGSRELFHYPPHLSIFWFRGWEWGDEHTPVISKPKYPVSNSIEIRWPTHCKVIPAESKGSTFSHSELHCYKQKYNKQCYIYSPQIGHNATFYLKVKLHKHILNRFSLDFMEKRQKQKNIETDDRCNFEASIRILGMWYICLFTSKGMGYLTFYYQGCGNFETQFGTFYGY